eukprot:5017427-Pyramimonas_sp.AAC.1
MAFTIAALTTAYGRVIRQDNLQDAFVGCCMEVFIAICRQGHVSYRDRGEEEEEEEKEDETEEKGGWKRGEQG